MDKQLQALQHNLEAVVQRAMESCKASGHAASDQFRGVTKLIVHGKRRVKSEEKKLAEHTKTLPPQEDKKDNP